VPRLTHTPELLDGPLLDGALLEANLRDMARANRLLGGTRLSLRAVAVLAPGSTPVTLLDVGTGGADIPLTMLRDARRRGRPMQVTAVDSRAEVLSAARALHPDLAAETNLTLELADGRALLYRRLVPTSRTPRWSSTTSKRTRQSRSSGSWPGSRGSGS
jgi:hypothetical protein